MLISSVTIVTLCARTSHLKSRWTRPRGKSPAHRKTAFLRRKRTPARRRVFCCCCCCFLVLGLCYCCCRRIQKFQREHEPVAFHDGMQIAEDGLFDMYHEMWCSSRLLLKTIAWVMCSLQFKCQMKAFFSSAKRKAIALVIIAKSCIFYSCVAAVHFAKK